MQSPLLRLPAELRNIIWKLAYSDERLDVQACCCQPRHHSGLRFKGSAPGLVCKQHWAEAAPIFLETCTFWFKDDSAFKEFLTTGSSVPAQVRRLAFHVDLILFSEERNGKDWGNTLMKVSHLSHELERLEGVHISATNWFYEAWMWQRFDLLGKDCIWSLVGLSELVWFFQRYRLKRELTSCNITDLKKSYSEKDYLDRIAQVSSDVRDHLLDYMGSE